MPCHQVRVGCELARGFGCPRGAESWSDSYFDQMVLGGTQVTAGPDRVDGGLLEVGDASPQIAGHVDLADVGLFEV